MPPPFETYEGFERIGRTGFTFAEAILPDAPSLEEVQRDVFSLARRYKDTFTATYYLLEHEETTVGVLGFHRWPDARKGYPGHPGPHGGPGIILPFPHLGRFEPYTQRRGALHKDYLQVVMGRRSGYEGESELADPEMFQTPDRRLRGWSAQEVHFIFASWLEEDLAEKQVNPPFPGFDAYIGDEMMLLRVKRSRAAVVAIFALAQTLDQYHIAIENMKNDKPRRHNQTYIYAGEPAQADAMAQEAHTGPSFTEEEVLAAAPILAMVANGWVSGIPLARLQKMDPGSLPLMQKLMESGHLEQRWGQTQRRVAATSVHEPYLRFTRVSLWEEARADLPSLLQRLRAT